MRVLQAFSAPSPNLLTDELQRRRQPADESDRARTLDCGFAQDRLQLVLRNRRLGAWLELRGDVVNCRSARRPRHAVCH